MSYPKRLKEQARQLAKDDDLSAEKIANIFSKEADRKEHNYRPEPRTIRNWISQANEKQTALAPEQLNLSRSHDRRIFKNSDKLMSEKDILGFLYKLEVGDSCDDSKHLRIFKFVDFFMYEGNKYVDTRLRELCNKLYDALIELNEFIGLQFYDIEMPKDFKDIRYKLQPNPNFKYTSGGLSPEFIELEEQLEKLVKISREAYSAYRVAVRETLFI